MNDFKQPKQRKYNRLQPFVQPKELIYRDKTTYTTYFNITSKILDVILTYTLEVNNCMMYVNMPLGCIGCLLIDYQYGRLYNRLYLGCNGCKSAVCLLMRSITTAI